MLVVSSIFVLILIRDNSVVDFEDENMKNVIEATLQTKDEITYRDMRKIKSLNIGLLDQYSTLRDLQWCVNLEELRMNGVRDIEDAEICNVNNNGEVLKILTQDEVNNICNDLKFVLPKLEKIKIFAYSNKYNNCEITDWSFLCQVDSLEKIYIMNCNVTDIEFIQEMKSIKEVYILDCNISEIKNVSGLNKLEYLSLVNNPIAENIEEMKKIEEILNKTVVRY